MKKAFELFIIFFKIGLFTFGGGYAMIPLIQKETVDNKKWIEERDILDIIAIAESTPGPIAINAATFIGYRVCGFLGALCATLGVVMPSFFIILLISFALEAFAGNEVIQYAFSGIRSGVLALIIKALYSMYKQFKKTKTSAISYIIIAFAFLATVLLKLNAIIVIIICAITGLISSLIVSRRENK